MKRIIILNGYPKSGKSLFATYLQEAYSKHNIKAHNVSSVDNVKKAAILLG